MERKKPIEKAQFSPEQITAIQHDSGPLQIIACAGSGKTMVISQRIAELIKKGTPPKQIVGFTFTEKAAEELKSRIRSILERDCPERSDVGDMYIGTIHSFCFYMLKELVPEYKSYDVLDDAKRVAFVSKGQNFYGTLKLRKLIPKSKGGKPLSYYTVITRFLTSVDIMMAEGIDPKKLSDREFAASYELYQELLDKEKYMDFSTMIYKLAQLLKSDPEKKKLLHSKIKHLIVDEYQDVNAIQEELISVIASGAASVCVVGDDDQCIYQWRGAEVKNIIDFKKRYGKKNTVLEVQLPTNYRSTEAIVNLAREFIKSNTCRISHKFMAHDPNLPHVFEPGDITHKHFKTEEEEYRWIAARIKEIQGADFVGKDKANYGISWGDVAVLIRYNRDAAQIIPVFEKEGIPCISTSGQSVFGRPEVQLALDCLAFAFGCTSYHGKQPMELTLKSDYLKVFDAKRFPRADPEAFLRKLRTLKKDIDKIYAKGEKDYLGDLGLQQIYHHIVNALGAEDFDWLANPFGEVYHANLAVLSQAISDYESVWVRLRASEVKFFYSFVHAYAESHYSEGLHADPLPTNAVKIMTIHKAKGLEFPVVFMPGLIQKRGGRGPDTFIDDTLYNIAKYKGTEEDERRVWYTAITRSEKYLVLTSSAVRPDAVKTYEPHGFIKELGTKFITADFATGRKKSGNPARFTPHSEIYATSFSELSCYDRCPHDFRLRHVFGYNAGVPVAFGYGTNIHNILNIIHNQYKQTGKVPTVEDVEVLFARVFKLRYATPKIEENMKKAGKKVVKNYVDLHKDQFKRILETEKNFEFVLNDALIAGQIDLLKKVDDEGKVTEVEIIDFKTEHKDGVYTLDYEKQLRMYAIACLKSLGLEPKKAAVHKLDSDTKQYVDISPKKLDETSSAIQKSVSSIKLKSFTATPSKDICSECDYRWICPFKKISKLAK